MNSDAEKFLIDFHARHTGATSTALGSVPVRCEGTPFDNSYELLVAHIPRTARRIADVACGDGYLLSRMLAAGFTELTGLDMSEAELERARQAVGDAATFIRCRAQEMPFDDGSFDAVTSHMALMLMEEPERVLSQARRILRDEGSLVAVVGGPFPPSPALDTYRSLIAPQIAASNRRVAIGDARWRTHEGISALLQQAAFRDVQIRDVEGVVVLPPAQLWDWFMLMYDAHFIDAATREALRLQFLAALDAGDSPSSVHLPIRWTLVLAAR